MTQLQLVKAFESTLRLMQANGMKIKDIQMASLVSEYDEMVKTGEQKGYIIQKLADKYCVSVRSVYSGIERLHSVVKEC